MGYLVPSEVQTHQPALRGQEKARAGLSWVVMQRSKQAALRLFPHVKMEGNFPAAQEVQGYRGAAFPQKASVLLTARQEGDFLLENDSWGEGARWKKEPLSPVPCPLPVRSTADMTRMERAAGADPPAAALPG